MKKVVVAFFLFTFITLGNVVGEEPLPPWETNNQGVEKKKKEPVYSFTPELAIEWVDGDKEGLRHRAGFKSEIKEEKWSLFGAFEGYRWQESAFGREKRDVVIDELRLERKEKSKTFRVGRYRTVIGSGVIWNPFDVLDPVEPNSVSLLRRGGNKASVDFIDKNGGVTSLYGFPDDEGRSKGFCLRHRRTMKAGSVHPFVFKFDDALWSYGIELSGNVGKNASWLQVGRLADHQGRGLQMLFGLDLAIPKAPLIRVEYFRNELSPLSGSPTYYRSIPPGPGFDLRQNFLRSSARDSIGLNVEGAKGNIGLRFDTLRSLDDGSSLFHLSLVRTLTKELDGLFSLWLPLDDGNDDYDGAQIVTLGLQWKR